MAAPLPDTAASPIVPARRAEALDALRGLAVLGMVLSGLEPREGLPAWMFHAQVPPPDHKFDQNLPGITWVDLVFPFFLFAMGAAIPLALARRAAKGARWPELLWNAVRRGLMLGAFALYVAHISPWSFADGVPTAGIWLRAILAFALLFPSLARLPDRWPGWVKEAVRFAGWGGMGLLMMSVRFPDGSGFSKERNDIIILILANVVVLTSAVWLLSRGNRGALVGLLAVLGGLRYVSSHSLPGSEALAWSPIPWLFRFGLALPSIVAVMGLVAGSLLLEWMGDRDAADADRWPARRAGIAAALAFALTPVATAGLYLRQLPLTAVLCAVLAAGVWSLTKSPGSGTERLCRRLVPWGAAFLAVGLMAEPFEGGIKKDPATLSYYFVCAGLAVFLLLSLTLSFDRAPGFLRAMGIITATGANPMIAYVTAGSFVGPLLWLLGVNPYINRLLEGRSAWWGFAHAVIVTLLSAWVVSLFTRARIFLRT